jgi:hypothetical protein
MTHLDAVMRREVLKDLLRQLVGVLPDDETEGPYLWWCPSVEHTLARIRGYAVLKNIWPLTEEELFLVEEAVVAAYTPLPRQGGRSPAYQAWLETSVFREGRYPTRFVEKGDRVEYDGLDERNLTDISVFALGIWIVRGDARGAMYCRLNELIDMGDTYSRIRRCIRDREDITLIRTFEARSGKIYTEIFFKEDVAEWKKELMCDDVVELRVLTSDSILIPDSAWQR